MHGAIKFRLSFTCLRIAFVVVRKILYRILTSNERYTKHSRNVENLFTDVDICELVSSLILPITNSALMRGEVKFGGAIWTGFLSSLA